MATKVIITEQYLKDVANAIREKSGTHLPLKPPEMAPAIKQIPQGITPEGTLEITENGHYDVADKESVDVDVPNPSSGALDIDENGNYDVRDKAFARVNVPLDPLVASVNGIYDRSKGGYDHVTVSVPPYSRHNKTMAITKNGTYNFKDDPSASGEEPPATLTVDVESTAPTPTGTKNITENGTYDVSDYATAQVDVPNPSTGTKSITENGTHNVKDYEFASVDVPPYGEGTTDIVTSEASDTYDVDGYKYAHVSVSMDELEVTQNGTYQPRYDQMIAGYSKVKVNVPNPATGTKNITENGTHNIKDYEYAEVDVPPYGEGDTDIVLAASQGTYDVDGYKRANISVSMDELEVTQNGTYQPRYDQMIAGYNKVKVNVPSTLTPEDEGKVVENGTLVSQSTKQITQNGTYDTTLKNQVIVAVPTAPAGSPQEILIKGATFEGTLTPNNVITIEAPSTISPAPSAGDIVIALGQEQQGYVIQDDHYLIVATISSVLSTTKVSAQIVYIESDILKVSGTLSINYNGLEDVSTYKQANVNVSSGATRTITTIEDATIYQGTLPTVGTPLTIVSTDTHPAVGDYAVVLGIRVYIQSGASHLAYYLIEGVVTSLDATNNRFTMTPDTVIEDVVKVSGGLVIDRAGTYTRDVTAKKTVEVDMEAVYESSDVKMIPTRYVTAHTGDPTTDTYIYVTLTENDMYTLEVSKAGTLVCTEFGTYMVTGIIQNKEHNTQDGTYTLEIEVVNQIS